jgi:hypothetical protein
MRSALLATLLCLHGCPILAQEVRLPTQVTGDVGDFVVVTADTEDSVVKWFVVDKGLKLFPQELQNDTKKAVVIALTPGRYRLLAVSAKDGTPSDFAECAVVIGGVVPVPPGPSPPPVPPDPTPAGLRELVVIRETADSTPQQARLLTTLRTGAFDTYLRSKGHRLYVLDDDSVGSDGRPSPLVEAWKPIVAGIPMPVLVIVEPKTRGVLAKQPLPESADAVLELLKQHGG